MNRPINPMRRKQIIRALLDALAMAGGYALEDSLLFGFVNDLVKPPLENEERTVITKFCDDEGWIRLVPDSMDPGLKQWVITELGRNTLASL
ncbi:MAG: hypothetical protein Q8Q59_15840 [Luteolibacter sp.]|nr:hypothetical protein [Luteolibacter sp.]